MGRTGADQQTAPLKNVASFPRRRSATEAKRAARRTVMFTVPSLQAGGAERVFVHLVNHVNRKAYAPVLALGAVRGEYLEDVRADVPIHCLGAERARSAVPAMVRMVWAVRPHIIVSTVGFNIALALARRVLPRDVRLIFREGSTPSAFLADVARTRPRLARLYRGVYRGLYRMADAVVCQSDYMVRDLAALGVPSAKLLRIYNPVDIERVRRLAAEGGGRVHDGPGPHIVTVGRLAHEKGYDVLLRAFALVLQKHRAASLTIVGDGRERANLEELARALAVEGAVRFVGFQRNPYAYFAGADLFVSSSRYEGFANAIVEAMACGIPVVATDCPSANREIIDEGATGWLARNEDPQSLAETLHRAVTTRTTIDTGLIRTRCEALYSVRSITARYEAVLEAVAGATA